MKIRESQPCNMAMSGKRVVVTVTPSVEHAGPIAKTIRFVAEREGGAIAVVFDNVGTLGEIQ
jgi:hypothetical protein